MKRISFEEIYLNLAIMLSQRSTCARLNVGCVITSSDYQRVLAIGYNGNAPGLVNACDSDIPGRCGCIHAEENAIIKCADAYVDKIVFLTHQPCKMCAKKLLCLGRVKKVIYKESYRSDEGLKLLKKAKIKVTKYKR